MELEHLQYRIAYDWTKAPFRVVLVEEKPTRRVIHYHSGRIDDYLDMPTPWIYHYLKFAKGSTADHPQIWDSRLYYAPTRMQNLRHKVFQSYLPNSYSDDAHTCWGRDFVYDVSDDIHEAVQYCLNAFWLRSFNFELMPTGAYMAALEALWCGRDRARWENYGARDLIFHHLEMISELSVDEILALRPAPALAIPDQVWIPSRRKRRGEAHESRSIDHYLGHRLLDESDDEDEDPFL